jgi:mannan endo-1,4-beta-mannosidase
MKKSVLFLEGAILFCCFLFFVNPAIAQIKIIGSPVLNQKPKFPVHPFLPIVRIVRSNIPVTQTVSLGTKTVPTIGWNGYKSYSAVYPLKISAVDTLFFSTQSDRDFVATGLTTAGITSITRVAVALPVVRGRRVVNYIRYAGRLYNYYYYCNGINNGYFTINGLTTKQNTTFSVSYDAADRLYSVIRNYNGNAYSEAINTYQALAANLASDLGSFSGTEYLDKSLINLGNFYFFLSRPTVPPPPPPPPPVGPLTVSGTKLLNHAGNPVTLIGVNTASYHSGYVNDVATVSNAMKNNTKVNSVRLMWNSQKGVNAIFAGQPQNAPTFFTLPNLDAELSAYTSLHILPILALHDLTDIDDNSVAGFNNYVVPFWTDPNLITILKKYQNNLIINLQNEWGATWENTFTAAAYINAYQGLVTQLRALGIHCPIMIDAPDGGTNSPFMIANGQMLINNDPDKNILLSVHTYWSQENGLIINCPADYISRIKAMAASNLPFVLGEASDWAVRGADGQDIPSSPPVTFACPGIGSANKYAVDYDAILTEACNDGIGFFAWSWYQDGNVVRNIYDQDSGTAINISAMAGSWPTDMLSSSKIYGLNNASIVPVF